MDRQVRLLGHSVHPMLIVFPLGLLGTSVVFDIVYFSTRNLEYSTVAYWMLAAGLIGGLVAAPYSTRARPQAPVAVPLDWGELSPRIHSDHFNIRNVQGRLAVLKKDPWKDFFTLHQSLPRLSRSSSR